MDTTFTIPTASKEPKEPKEKKKYYYHRKRRKIPILARLFIALFILFSAAISLCVYSFFQYRYLSEEFITLRQENKKLEEDVKDYVFFTRIITDNLAATLYNLNSKQLQSLDYAQFDISDRSNPSLSGERGFVNVSASKENYGWQMASTLLNSIPNIWPLGQGIGHITSTDRKGIDICVGSNTNYPVFAAAAGKVIATGFEKNGYGNFIMLLHPYGFITLYGYLQDVKIKWGQSIAKGTVIGTVGGANHSHLHYEVRIQSVAVDPLSYISPNSTDTEPFAERLKIAKEDTMPDSYLQYIIKADTDSKLR